MGNIFGSIFPRALPKTYSQTTTNNTVTTVATIAVPEGQTVSVKVNAVTRNSDGSINGTFSIGGIFYRNSGGDVTQIGTTQDIFTDYTDGATIQLDVAADTGNQTIDVNVTGQTSETFTWDVEVEEPLTVNT